MVLVTVHGVQLSGCRKSASIFIQTICFGLMKPNSIIEPIPSIQAIERASATPWRKFHRSGPPDLDLFSSPWQFRNRVFFGPRFPPPQGCSGLFFPLTPNGRLGQRDISVVVLPENPLLIKRLHLGIAGFHLLFQHADAGIGNR